jgi:hypothetical protein
MRSTGSSVHAPLPFAGELGSISLWPPEPIVHSHFYKEVHSLCQLKKHTTT